MTLRSLLAKGLAAGAAGTTALNAVTYADMALRGRAPSELPQHAVESAMRSIGQDVPGEGETRQHRLDGLAALSGIMVGLGIGAVAGLAGPVLRRLPLGLGAVVVGGAAMAATDVPTALSGLSDPREWSAADWLSDAVPHLGYGVATAWTLRAM